ncbi:endonuclease/exonuclease/phosphatase family protein [Zunongwangia sp. HGR-M22]|uniref:endonuclease/exonuclease/phosphatase family protein n=1 Tax=Zunongwangia sp. HGR-M22 TaxID=3015168 RepID=UPI0022DDAFDC|nr:endonuclease/exonuclease/phosphatase family protein [Zunongwangia sp. HGR-M22]WBL24545.1 endonuclease/exonuclease/phosphatase family protein [Zunongwangia sp. HGR-M22]
MKKLSWFDKFIFFLNSLLAIGLIIAYFLPYIPPKSYPLISVLTLGVPILIMANLVFFLYWLIRMKRQMLLSLIIMIVGFGFASKFYQWPYKENNPTGDYSIMNYNVRMFNKSKWTDEENITEKINAVIEEKNPDILTIEEYYKNEYLEAKYPYQFIKYRTDNSSFGQAIFSKFPLLSKESIDFNVDDFTGENNNAIFSDVVIDKDTVRLYNIHFQSLKVTEDIQDVNNLKHKQESKKVVKNISGGFVRQQRQAERVERSFKDVRYPIIISGDFNNTAFSHTYAHVRNGRFQDSYVKKGGGFSSTYNLNYFPLRIDFHLLDTVFEIKSYERIKVPYSDHYPILTTFSFKN